MYSPREGLTLEEPDGGSAGQKILASLSDGRNIGGPRASALNPAGAEFAVGVNVAAGCDSLAVADLQQSWDSGCRWPDDATGGNSVN